MKAIIISLIVVMLGCNPGGRHTGATTYLNIDSIERVDSMKWLYYALNHYGQALFYDTMKQERVAFDPVTCGIVLNNYYKTGGDTLSCHFSLVKGNLAFRYVHCLYAGGIGYSGGGFRPLYHLIKLDYDDVPDSVNAYLKRADTTFRRYLKNYRGEIDPWLRKEAIRKKVLQ